MLRSAFDGQGAFMLSYPSLDRRPRENTRVLRHSGTVFGLLVLLLHEPIAAAQKNATGMANDRVLYAQAAAQAAAKLGGAKAPDRDKRLIRQYFEEHPVRSVGSVPLPDDWRSQVRPGRQLPIALSAQAQPMPADLSLALGEADAGLTYVRIKQTILRIDATSQKVLDRFEL